MEISLNQLFTVFSSYCCAKTLKLFIYFSFLLTPGWGGWKKAREIKEKWLYKSCNSHQKACLNTVRSLKGCQITSVGLYSPCHVLRPYFTFSFTGINFCSVLSPWSSLSSVAANLNEEQNNGWAFYLWEFWDSLEAMQTFVLET